MVPPAASSQECSAARCASLVGAAAAAGGVEPALRFLEPAIAELELPTPLARVGASDWRSFGEWQYGALSFVHCKSVLLSA